jgi:hypothetical protein
MSRPVPLFAITTASKITGKIAARWWTAAPDAARIATAACLCAGPAPDHQRPRPRPAHQRPPQARNIYGYKSYTECTETSHFLAWRPMEYHWYCTSLAFNK